MAASDLVGLRGAGARPRTGIPPGLVDLSVCPEGGPKTLGLGCLLNVLETGRGCQMGPQAWLGRDPRADPHTLFGRVRAVWAERGVIAAEMSLEGERATGGGAGWRPGIPYLGFPAEDAGCFGEAVIPRCPSCYSCTLI